MNAANIKLREKINTNHRRAQNMNGLLAVSLDRYYECIPLVDMTELKSLTDTEVTEWVTYMRRIN